MVGGALHRRGKGEQLVFRAVQRHQPHDFELPFGDGAGLIEHHRIDLGRKLQHGGAAHQDAAPRQAADGRHHRGGRRQNQRARTSYNQHRNRAHPVPRKIQCERSGQQEGRQKISGPAVGQALDGRAFLLRLPHQFHHPGQRGLLTRARHPNAQQPTAIERARVDFIPLGLLAGQRLAGDGAFVDGRTAVHDLAIRGQSLAGAHQDQIAFYQRGGVHVLFHALAQPPCAARHLLYEALDCGGGAARRVRLQSLAHQHDEHGLRRGQVLSDRKRRDHRDTQRDVRRDTPLQQRRNRVVEGLIAGQQRDGDGRVQPEDRFEDPQPVQPLAAPLRG
jgi:hypothetical protein